MSQDANGSATAGSPQTQDVGVDNAQSNSVPRDMYDNLESKLGAQGQELGEYREFFKSIEPILEKLDASPELARAIVDGKIDENLIQAVSEGRISLDDAQVATQAKENVEKNLGKGVSGKTATEVQELISQEVQKLREETQRVISEDKELRNFESKVEQFISSTPDFDAHAPAIEKWLEEHPNIDDIAVAYYAVKGELTEKEAKKAAEADATAQAKDIALAAMGGASAATAIAGGDELVDVLIQGNTTPNKLW